MRTRDGGILYAIGILAMNIVPVFLIEIVRGAFQGESNIILNYISTALIQITLLITVMVFCKVKKANRRTIFPTSKFNIWIALLLIPLGLIYILGLNGLNTLFIKLLELIGIKGTIVAVGFNGAIEIILAFLIIAILPAFAEEMFVRGGILSCLHKQYNGLKVILLTAMMFAIMHMNVSQLVYQFIFGFSLAYLVVLTGSIWYSIILHFINNASVIISLIMGIGDETIDEISISVGSAFGYIAIAIGAIIAIVMLLWLIGSIANPNKSKKGFKFFFVEGYDYIKEKFCSVNDTELQPDEFVDKKIIWIYVGFVILIYVFNVIFVSIGG